MIKGTTTSGFKYEISPKTFHSMKVIRKIAGIKEDTPISETFEIMEQILGSEQFERFLDHCDEEATDERFGDAIFSDEMKEMFEKLGAEKDTKN